MESTEAFIEVVKQHDRGLRALAYRLLRDRETMDDVMQEAYLKAFRGLAGFRKEAQSGTWLYRIVYNACLDRLRSDRRAREVSLELVTEAAEMADPAAGPAETVAWRGDLDTALASLPPGQRAVVLLVDADGFSYDEAAAVLGVPAGTIASRLNHARSTLRGALSERSGHEAV
jgi:RNA polymerase sigma-70 factor (ECF subfamily)